MGVDRTIWVLDYCKRSNTVVRAHLIISIAAGPVGGIILTTERMIGVRTETRVRVRDRAIVRV